MEFIREDCIYARQSVDRKDSISIESQIDFCKYELKGGSCRVFKDKGYSGKNTDRPEFQKLLGEIRKGKVRRVIVYKLDRISRSILDFATMMELFQEYDVEFVSSTEKFDTSTPMGRAMLNICIVFAQLERETIQKRVTDAYYSRCLKGFHMSGQAPYRKDSISIESQIDFCKYELKGGSCRVFKDKGYSGKNTDRPEFQKLLGEIRKGKVRRVIVYKLDRISRSILDFATMMELFQEYDVEFVSSTEKFDTSTPMGRAMLNICIVFAQLERETIQKRVTDAYYSRCLKGFHMSGQAPYGYQLEPTVVEGIRTKKMVADPVAADHVRLMFEMYAEPETSFGDITRYFEEHDIKIYGKSMFRTFLSQLLRNPVYAQADLELYEFFKSQGAAIVNDASDFAGTNGCYLYQGRDVKEDKDRCLKDQILVIAPHEALISSDTWLKCRKKLMANTTFQQGRKPKNTWLAGKIKCGHCGYALKATHVPNSTGYFRCTKRTENKGCPGCGKIRKEEFEQFIFSAMQEKFKDFQILHGREEKVNPKLTAYQVELAQVEAEIEKLLDTLTGANATLLAYANKKIEELDTRRQTISKAIAELSVETISPQQIKKLSYYLDNWDSIDFDDKRKAADGLISTIKATSDRVQIEWKI